MSAVWHRRGSARTGTCIVAPCLGLWACSAVHHDPVCTAGRLRWGLACLATHTHTTVCWCCLTRVPTHNAHKCWCSVFRVCRIAFMDGEEAAWDDLEQVGGFCPGRLLLEMRRHCGVLDGTKSHQQQYAGCPPVQASSPSPTCLPPTPKTSTGAGAGCQRGPASAAGALVLAAAPLAGEAVPGGLCSVVCLQALGEATCAKGCGSWHLCLQAHFASVLLCARPSSSSAEPAAAGMLPSLPICRTAAPLCPCACPQAAHGGASAARGAGAPRRHAALGRRQGVCRRVYQLQTDKSVQVVSKQGLQRVACVRHLPSSFSWKGFKQITTVLRLP